MRLRRGQIIIFSSFVFFFPIFSHFHLLVGIPRCVNKEERASMGRLAADKTPPLSNRFLIANNSAERGGGNVGVSFVRSDSLSCVWHCSAPSLAQTEKANSLAHRQVNGRNTVTTREPLVKYVFFWPLLSLAASISAHTANGRWAVIPPPMIYPNGQPPLIVETAV